MGVACCCVVPIKLNKVVWPGGLLWILLSIFIITYICTNNTPRTIVLKYTPFYELNSKKTITLKTETYILCYSSEKFPQKHIYKNAKLCDWFWLTIIMKKNIIIVIVLPCQEQICSSVKKIQKLLTKLVYFSTNLAHRLKRLFIRRHYAKCCAFESHTELHM